MNHRHYELCDSVKLRQAITLADGQNVAASTPGVVVEVFAGGEAYLVELFGDWVKVDPSGEFIPADANDQEAFTETIGLATLSEQQLELLKPAQQTVGARTQLLTVVDDLPEAMLTEVVDFAEFLRQKQRRQELA
ncbi:MAG TPA: hypothetical protein PLK31_02825 [Chloroflexota bacterium]|nr:hypothetical protein [Chloroflexota bacterium]